MSSIEMALQNLVFTWLDTIANGTNIKVVNQLLTPQGISYTFQIPLKQSRRLLEKWKKRNDEESGPLAD